MTIRYPDYEADLVTIPYEFYTLGVWESEGNYYMSTDTGCSCPTPWESHSVDDLTGPLTYEQMAEEARSLAYTSYDRENAVREVETMLRAIP